MAYARRVKSSHGSKMDHSLDFGLSLVPSDEVGTALKRGFRHFVELQRLLIPTKDQWYPCGGYMMSPGSMDYDPQMHAKQAALFRACKPARSVLEIGVHGGHSLLLALLANDTSSITCMDIGAYDHTLPCVQYLQSQFPGRVVYVQGDSSDILPKMHAVFDVVHVDGDHSYEGVKRDIYHAIRLSHENTTFVIDDYCDGVKLAVDETDLTTTHVPGCMWTNCVLKRSTKNKVPMNVGQLVRHVQNAWRRADALESKLSLDVLELEGMSGTKTRHLYNNLCDFAGCRYLEVGCWKGSSTIASLYNNEAHALVIDNWAEFGGPRAEFLANIEKHIGPGRVKMIERDCFDVFPHLENGAFNVYLYDGHHSEECQKRAIVEAASKLKNPAVVIVDDWNEEHIRRGTEEGFLESGLRVAWTRELITQGVESDGYWNGIAVFVVSGTKTI